MELYEDTFLSESRKSLCYKGLSGFYGFIRSYENRPLSNNTQLHDIILLYQTAQDRNNSIYSTTKPKIMQLLFKKLIMLDKIKMKNRKKLRKIV